MFSIKEILCGALCAMLVAQLCWAEDAVELYRIDPDRSVIYVYTESAGLLGSLGHRHIISLRGLSGHLEISARQSGNARLFLAPEKFVVDAPADRAKAQPPYDTAITSEDREATRHNMLGPALLNAGRYPRIDIDVELLALQGEHADFAVRIGMQERVYPFRISGRLTGSGDEMLVFATFALEHRELGLKPYSALAGMLKVAESLHFEVKLIARRLEGIWARDFL